MFNLFTCNFRYWIISSIHSGASSAVDKKWEMTFLLVFNDKLLQFSWDHFTSEMHQIRKGFWNFPQSVSIWSKTQTLETLGGGEIIHALLQYGGWNWIKVKMCEQLMQTNIIGEDTKSKSHLSSHAT